MFSTPKLSAQLTSYRKFFMGMITGFFLLNWYLKIINKVDDRFGITPKTVRNISITINATKLAVEENDLCLNSKKKIT